MEINQAKWMFKAKKGGAEVSSLHSNFLVNQGIASAEDVEELGRMIIKQSKKKVWSNIALGDKDYWFKK